MLHSLTANKDSFHPVTFHPGLNLIIAKRLPASSSMDTCNGLGKSTLIRVIDFCLGASTKGKDALPVDNLTDWEFTLELDIGSSKVKVSRRCNASDDVFVDGDVRGWPLEPDMELSDGRFLFSVENWRKILGWGFYDLPVAVSGEEAIDKRIPSARGLLNFAIRKSYENELKAVSEGKAAPRDIALAFLFGLDWRSMCRIDHLISSASEYKTVKGAAKIEMSEWRVSKVSELKKMCGVEEVELEAKQKQLSEFEVSDQYHKVEQHASELTTEIHRLRNENSRRGYQISSIERSLRTEADIDFSIEDVYRAAGVEIGGLITRRIEEVKDFHRRLLAHREGFLLDEKSRLESAMVRDQKRIDRLEAQRRDDYIVLHTTKALEEFTMLQSRLTTDYSVLAKKKDCLERYQKSDKALKQVSAQKKDLVESAIAKFKTSDTNRNSAEDRFCQICKMFYDKPGTLGIEFRTRGKPKIRFAPEFPKDRSDGIEKIKVFTFDLTMFEQQRKCGRKMDFLVHDSSIFDSVDPRQVAKALEEADRVTVAGGSQYICALNADKLPVNDFTTGYDVNGKIVLTLEDGPMQNSLLGVGF